MVALLKSRQALDDKQVETNFLLSDNIWAKATIPNESGRVGLWLGANVMVEYSLDDAMTLLTANLENAEMKLEETEGDIDFLKDQITTTEVNMARIYNQGVANKQKKEGTYAAEKWVTIERESICKVFVMSCIVSHTLLIQN